MYDKSSYRQCVGITVFNPDGNIWIGKRSNISGRKRIWQMPQGGINDGEIPLDAAKRELFEETGYVSNDFQYLGIGRLMINRTNSIQHLFVAKEAIKNSPPKDKNTKVIKLTQNKLFDLIKTGLPL